MIIAVTGFTRSGTSLTMRMLYEAGLSIYADDQREPFEHSNVTRLEHGDHAWFNQVEGNAIKVLDPLNYPLPSGFDYKIIWLNRPINDLVVSQLQFLGAITNSNLLTRENKRRLSTSILRDRPKTMRLLQSHNCPLLTVNFTDLIQAPLVTAARIQEFLELPDGSYEKMAKCVRQRDVAPQNLSVEISML